MDLITMKNTTAKVLLGRFVVRMSLEMVSIKRNTKGGKGFKLGLLNTLLVELKKCT